MVRKRKQKATPRQTVYELEDCEAHILAALPSRMIAFGMGVESSRSRNEPNDLGKNNDIDDRRCQNVCVKPELVPARRRFVSTSFSRLGDLLRGEARNNPK